MNKHHGSTFNAMEWILRPVVRKPALIAILLASTAACTTVPGPTTKCVTREQYEQLKRDEPERVADKLSGKADEDTRVLAGSAVRLRAWGNGLLTVLGGCVGEE